MDPNPRPEPVRPTLIPAQVAPAPMAPPPRRVSLLSVIVIVLLVIFLGGSVLLNLVLMVAATGLESESRVREKHRSGDALKPDKVAIISIDGVILDGEGFVKRQIDQALKDSWVKAVVLRVDSPGGSVSASDQIYHQLKKLTQEKGIPLVVSMGGIAASGGYYVSMATGPQQDVIFAEPTTWTGSIGVIIPHYDASKALEDLGVKQDSIGSHRLKGMGSFTRKMTTEEREILQALVDDAFGKFKKIVQDARPKFKQTPTALDKLATGQVYAADQALQNGLIDKIGYLDDAVNHAISLAGLSADDVNVVEYKREFSFLDVVAESRANRQAFDPTTLLELAVPRAYYLCSSLPIAISSRGVRD